MAELPFTQIDVSVAPLPAIQFAQANAGGGRLVIVNRARLTVGGTFISWRSYDAQDLAMSSCPGSPNPADYSDFVVWTTFWEAS